MPPYVTAVQQQPYVGPVGSSGVHKLILYQPFDRHAAKCRYGISRFMLPQWTITAVRLVASGVCLAELLVFSTKRIGIQIHLAQRSGQRELARMRSTACAPHRRVGAPRTTEGLMVVVRYRCLPERAWPAGCVEAHYLH